MIVIPLSWILPPSRNDIDYRSVLQSVRRIGQIEPIVVRHRHNGYQVLDGQKRVLAMRELGATEIHAEVLN